MEMNVDMEDFDGHLDEGSCQMVAEFFTVYANTTRINIFCALRSGRKTVSELAEYADVSLQNASQHLRIMRDRGAVIAEKEGQHVYYRIANPKFLYGVKMIRDALTEDLNQRMNAMNNGRTAE